MTQAHFVSVERRGELAWITIDRADKANALLPETMGELTARLREAAADTAVKAIVLTGAGTRAFSGGVDVRTPSPLPKPEAMKLRSQRFSELLLTAAELPKPVVAAMNGIASGGGAMLALVCDRIVAVQDAAFALPEIDLGGPTFPAIAILRHLAGAGIAADLVQTGRRMGVTEAASHGLVAEVVPADALQARAEAAAMLLGSKAARAFALNKQWLNKPMVAGLHAAHDDMAAMRAAGGH